MKPVAVCFVVSPLVLCATCSSQPNPELMASIPGFLVTSAGLEPSDAPFRRAVHVVKRRRCVGRFQSCGGLLASRSATATGDSKASGGADEDSPAGALPVRSKIRPPEFEEPGSVCGESIGKRGSEAACTVLPGAKTRANPETRRAADGSCVLTSP